MTRTKEEYQAAVQAVALCGQLLAQHDLKGILEDISRAEVVGPFLDPTLWIKKNQAMREDADLFKAALPLAALVTEVLASLDDGR